jgi:hypothetical protein
MSKIKRYKFSCCVIDAENLVENRDFPIKSFSTFLHPLELTKSNHKESKQKFRNRKTFVDIGKIEY